MRTRKLHFLTSLILILIASEIFATSSLGGKAKFIQRLSSSVQEFRQAGIKQNGTAGISNEGRRDGRSSDTKSTDSKQQSDHLSGQDSIQVSDDATSSSDLNPGAVRSQSRSTNSSDDPYYHQDIALLIPAALSSLSPSGLVILSLIDGDGDRRIHQLSEGIDPSSDDLSKDLSSGTTGLPTKIPPSTVTEIPTTIPLTKISDLENIDGSATLIAELLPSKSTNETTAVQSTSVPAVTTPSRSNIVPAGVPLPSVTVEVAPSPSSPSELPTSTEKPEVTNTERVWPTSTWTATPLPTPTPTGLPLGSPTATLLVPSPTSTSRETLSPSATATVESSPSSTVVPTLSLTPMPGVSPDVTKTSVEGTQTPTAVPTQTPTNTDIPTLTPTNTDIPTVTAVPSETWTPVLLPTDTPSATSSPTSSLTSTPIPSVTPSSTSSPTVTTRPTVVLPTLTPTNTAIPTVVLPTVTPDLGTPLWTDTPQPTYTALPTLTPRPTYTALPTLTPRPAWPTPGWYP